MCKKFLIFSPMLNSEIDSRRFQSLRSLNLRLNTGKVSEPSAGSHRCHRQCVRASEHQAVGAPEELHSPVGLQHDLQVLVLHAHAVYEHSELIRRSHFVSVRHRVYGV